MHPLEKGRAAESRRVFRRILWESILALHIHIHCKFRLFEQHSLPELTHKQFDINEASPTALTATATTGRDWIIRKHHFCRHMHWKKAEQQGQEEYSGGDFEILSIYIANLSYQQHSCKERMPKL